MINLLVKSIAAGMMIGIACVISLTVSHPIVSPIMFSIGLLVICARGYFLYTGKIGYVSYRNALSYPIIISGNSLGVAIIAIVKPIDTSAIAAAKLANPPWLVFVYAVLCGWLMYVAVDTYNKGSIIGIICCVPAFIICGFEHSIADMYYLRDATMSLRTFWFITACVLGNAVGANLHRQLDIEKD